MGASQVRGVALAMPDAHGVRGCSITWVQMPTGNPTKPVLMPVRASRQACELTGVRLRAILRARG